MVSTSYYLRRLAIAKQYDEVISTILEIVELVEQEPAEIMEMDIYFDDMSRNVIVELLMKVNSCCSNPTLMKNFHENHGKYTCSIPFMISGKKDLLQKVTSILTKEYGIYEYQNGVIRRTIND